MDFDNSPQTVTFPSTNTNDEMTITITLIDDNINEAEEGFYLLATLDRQQSSSADLSSFTPIRNGVAEIDITDNDREYR